MKKIVLIILFSGSLILVFIFFGKDNFQENTLNLINNPKATPFLFEELTIPYLRNREYTSNLADLTRYSENATYTSYLTSYTSDNLKINGLLTIPKGEEPSEGFPAIVFVHGYIAPTIYKTTERYGDYVDYLARNGLVVFKIDLRGHDDSEGEPGGAYYSSDYVIDTLNAYKALQNTDFVNPKKIGLWGHSMAGNVTFKSFVVAQDIPALVIWAGAGYTYSDLLEYKISDNSYRPPAQNNTVSQKRQKLRETYGEFDPKNAFWKQVPATNYLVGVFGAVQLDHAQNDDVVSVEYSRNLTKILDTTNITHEFFEYESGGHNISGTNFTKAMQNTVEFFKKYLK